MFVQPCNISMQLVRAELESDLLACISNLALPFLTGKRSTAVATALSLHLAKSMYNLHNHTR